MAHAKTAPRKLAGWSKLSLLDASFPLALLDLTPGRLQQKMTPARSTTSAALSRLAFPMHTIGLISDTYGLVRAEVLLALRGVDLILHAGDVGGADVLGALAAIAPVRAVRGDADSVNADSASADSAHAAGLEPRIDEKFEQVHVVVTHGHELVRPEPPRLVSAYMHADVIVYGHTRLPLITRAARRLIINPGAAGASYLGASPTVARLYIDGRQCDAQLMRLFPGDPDELLSERDEEDQ